MRMGGVRIAKWGVALALASLALPPLAAQQATTNAVTPAPAPAPDTIGPGELRDFSLPGTVTRRTETPAAGASPGNGTRQPETPPSDAAPLAVRSRPVPSTEPSRSVTVALPPPDPLAQRPTLAPPVNEASTVASPPVIETVAPPPAAVPAVDDSGSWLPWLFALVLAAGIGAFFLWRQRNAGRLAYAGGERVEELVGTPRPVPAAAPAAPRMAPPVPAPAPAPTPPRGDGIVSARLRPWLEIEFGATRAVVTDDATTIHFDVTLFNSGGAPARDVRVEAQMFNAGPAQDSELGAFFGRPAPPVTPIPEIAPLARIDMKSAVALPREQVKEYDVEGRKLFVPIMGFNAHYRFGTSPAQTSASFIVGRGGDDGGKMAPIRLDLGPRIFRGLTARQHSAGVRA